MEPKIVDLLCYDIDSLSRKLIELMPASREATLAAGSLAAAAHILRALQATQPVPQYGQYQPQTVQLPPQQQFPAIPGGSPDNLNIEALAMAVASKMGMGGPAPQSPQSQQRSLAKEWAGPLPSMNGLAPAVVTPAIRAVKQTAKCRACGELVVEHNFEKKTGLDEHGRAVFVLCGNDANGNPLRVRCVPTEE